jgi:hypothetical protein
MRHCIMTAIAFDASQPEYLLIEYGNDGVGRMVGQYFKVEDAIQGAHIRANKAPQLQVIEGRKPRERA